MALRAKASEFRREAAAAGAIRTVSTMSPEKAAEQKFAAWSPNVFLRWVLIQLTRIYFLSILRNINAYFMNKITLPKSEYVKLRKRAAAYQKLIGSLFKSVVHDSIEDVVSDFRKTDLYTEGFLKDLKGGLQKSSLGKS